MAKRSWRFGPAAALKVDAELYRWKRLGVRPRLWWRDDDARAPTPALDRLLDVANGRPIALAVIPDGDLDALASKLAAEANVSVGQHGVDHTKRRPAGEANSEYIAPPSLALLTERIGRSRDRMVAAGLWPSFYTPPWNAVDLGLDKALARVGIPLLSAGADPMPEAVLPCLSAELDILRWKGGPRFKGELRLMSALGQALATRRKAGRFDQPIGLLTHHLDHDEASWRFLEQAIPFFDMAFDWVSVERAILRPFEVRAA